MGVRVQIKDDNDDNSSTKVKPLSYLESHTLLRLAKRNFGEP